MSCDNTFNRYLLIDLRTGLMDGMYGHLDSAEEVCEYLNEKYIGSSFVIFKGMSGDKDFEGVFPPDHLFHCSSKLSNFYETPC